MYDISLKRKWDAEAVRMYQEGLEEQLGGLEKQLEEAKKAEKEAKRVSITAKAEGLAEGKAEGLAQGEHKKAIETALKLIKMSLSLEQIAEATGLTINEIEKLK